MAALAPSSGEEPTSPRRAGGVDGEVDAIQFHAGSKKCDFQTPLIQAALENRLEVVELLIEKGANVNANDNDFRTALMYAAKEGHVAVVEALLKAEPDLTLSDNDDLTAPMLAALFDQDAVVEIFKAAGVTQFEKEDSDDY